jgi:peptide/nickel transport system substrate-binding protein
MFTALPRIAAIAAILTTLTAAAVAAPPDSLVLGVQLEPPHLDPTAGAAAAIDEITYANVFEGLTRIDAEGRVRPGLADRWEVSADGLTYTFHLREKAAFHDGRPLESAHVRFSLDRARGPQSVNAQKGYFAPIAAVETPDPRTAVVRLSRPDALFLFHMGQGDAAIVAPETAEANKRAPVGTGPFRFERWVAGDRVTLVRNPAYDGPKPALESVTFRFISDPAAQVAALLAGDVDSFPLFGTYDALDQFRADSRFRVTVGSTEGETILAINNGRKPLDDVRVRRALSHALDRNAVIQGAMAGTAQPIGSHFPPHHPAYVDLTGMYPHDAAKAKALLAEAGYPNGLELSLKLPPQTHSRRSGELIAAMLAEAGIRVRIENVEWAAWLENVFRAKDYDLTIVSHTEPLDIEIYGRDSYYFNYRSDRFRAAAKGLETAADEAALFDTYRALQRIVAEDAVNVFLFQLPSVTVEDARLTGMWANRPVQANDVTAVRWAR